MRIGSLFSGYGGLEQGVQSVLGGSVAWHSEIDPGACKILAHRYPDVPNLGDITAVDWAAVEPVDVLTGGFPCQDLSAAGRRKGMRPGTRSGLWADFKKAIGELRPSLVVIENVRGLLYGCAETDAGVCEACAAGDDLELDEGSVGDGRHRPLLRALGRVLGDLANIGFDAEWIGLRASDIGAPHDRFRVFVFAWPAADTGGLRRPAGWSAGPGEASGGGPLRLTAGRALSFADPAGDRLEGGVRQPSHSQAGGEGPGHYARVRGGAVLWGIHEPAIRRWERLTRPAPSPVEPGTRGRPRIHPPFSEWMQGLPAGWVTDVPGLTRNEQLKALGNGVVPQQAAQALRILLPALERAA